MKKLIVIIASLTLLAALGAGCASNTKVVETLDPATGQVKERTTTSVTDTAQQAKAQVDYAKLMLKNGIFEIEAAEKKTEQLDYDAAGKVVGKTITTTYEPISISGAKRVIVRVPMPKWTLVTEAWERALAKANGWINMIAFGWLFGPQNYDTGTTNNNLATSGNQSNINVGGKQSALGSHVAGGAEGSTTTGGSMNSSDSSQQNRGDETGFGDIGEVF